MNNSKDDRPWVVLIHGLGAHRAVMLPLKWELERSGFAVHNFGYNSLRSIEHAADRLAIRLEELNRRHGPAVLHLVGHSMGCIVSRLALQRQRPANFQRMVMITPPSRGTPTADRIAPWLGWCVPSIPELPDWTGQSGQLPAGPRLSLCPGPCDLGLPYSGNPRAAAWRQ